MSGRERLQTIQTKLEARGCVDIKIAWGWVKDKPLSLIASEVADVLEAYLDGKVHPLPPFNDHLHAWRKDGTFYLCDSCGAVSPVADDSECRLAQRR